MIEKYQLLLEVGILIATLFGWYFTHRKQEEMLNIELDAKREKSQYDIVFPMKVERINNFLEWLIDGDKIFLRLIGIANINRRLNMQKGGNERDVIINEKTKEAIQKMTLEINEKMIEWMPNYVPYRTMITTMKEFENSNIKKHITEYYFTVVVIADELGEVTEENSYDSHVSKMIKIFELVESVMNK